MLLLAISLGHDAKAQSASTVQAAPELYNKAMNAFASGDFSEAVNGLEQLLAQGAEGPGAEGIHFSLAAAHFNKQNTTKAKSAFENYLKLYPNGSKSSDALLSIAQCQVLLGEKDRAVTTFEAVIQKGGATREQALLSKASLLKELGKQVEAAEALQSLISGGLKTPESIQAAILLGVVEAERGERKKALNILEQLQGRFLPLIDNPLQLNALAFDVGDAFLHAFELKPALTAYAMVRRKEETILLQQQRIQNLAKRIEFNFTAAKNDPSRSLEITSANNRLKTLIEAAKQTLEQTQNAPDNLFALRARQAAAFQELGRLDEAILLFESLSASSDKTGKEDTLLNLGSLYAKNGDPAASIKVLSQLLSEFPELKSLDSALLLLGTQHLQQDQLEPAAKAFESLLKQKPKSAQAPTARFLLANTRLTQARYKDAVTEYQTYLKSFPSSDFSDEAEYRIGLSHFFAGEYQLALDALENYIKKHPDGLFAPDAFYRIAACYQAARKSDDVAKRCVLWEAKYGDHPVSGDVLALHGDALAMLNKHEEAIGLYRKASLQGATDEVVQYALFEANKLLQKLGRTEDASQMFREFLAAKPEHPANVLAMYWTAKGMHKVGKTEEAKAFLADKIAGFIGDRSKDAVEQLIAQLAQLCAKPPRESQETAPAVPYNAQESLSKHLGTNSLPDNPLIRARILYAQAELARIQRKPEAASLSLDTICDQIPPQALGAALLAQSGDRLLERQDSKRALDFYSELMTSFPKSELLDYAFNGHGQIALIENKPEEALRWFTDAVDKVGATTKLRDVTLGRAKALLQLGKLDESKALLEQVASTREWRGECTAEAVFLLGQLAELKGDLTGAVQFYQRVFVAYQRYERFVGKAYLKTAECFEKLNEPTKAEAHYRELATKPRLSSLPETQTAKQRLLAKDPQ